MPGSSTQHSDVGRGTLVHGDFHHQNILRASDRYVAIDPKSMLGEAEYDVAAFLWNPLPYRMEREVTAGRLAAFAAAGLDERRMRAWAVIRGAYLGADPGEASVLRPRLRRSRLERLPHRGGAAGVRR